MKGLLKSAWKPALAVAMAAGLCWLLLAFSGYDAGLGFTSLYEATFKNLRMFGNMLNKACPLLFCGLAVGFSFRGNVFNLGADGQFLMGAVAATWVGIALSSLPGFLLIPAIMIAGALGGALWGLCPGYFKARYQVPEVITTIMFNHIALQFVAYLVRYPLKDTTQINPQSAPIAAQGQLGYMLEGTKLHAGFLAGCIIALLIFFLLFKTYLGFEIRSVGYNRVAAKFGGVNISRMTVATMLISGALAGLGGAFEIAGSSHYLYEVISSGYGYTAIAVAILAMNNPIGIVFSALLFGFLNAGTTAMQRAINVSASFVDLFQVIIIIFVAIATVATKYKSRPTLKKSGLKFLSKKEVA
ncbi:MAG: ABC transporter permease [Bacillota bacterium]